MELGERHVGTLYRGGTPIHPAPVRNLPCTTQRTEKPPRLVGGHSRNRETFKKRNAAPAATGTNTGRIFTMLWYEGHDGLLVRQTGMSDLGGCGRNNCFILDRNHGHFKEMHALLISAHLTDQNVTIDVDGCHQGLGRIRNVHSIRN